MVAKNKTREFSVFHGVLGALAVELIGAVSKSLSRSLTGTGRGVLKLLRHVGIWLRTTRKADRRFA
jgi:hypothetical protein